MAKDTKGDRPQAERGKGETKNTSKREPAKIVTIFSSKGGVGKTFIAANLALALGEKDAAKVIILDLDLNSGDAASILNLKPKRTISDLADNIDFYTPTDVEKLLTPFNEKVKVLAAPLQPDLADTITPVLIRQLLVLLREIADFIIIDCPSYFNDNVLAAITETNAFFLVSTVDLLSLKSALLALQTLRLLEFPEDRIKLILNQSGNFNGLTGRETEQSLGFRIWAEVPFDRAVSISVNTGLPLIINFPRTRVAKSIFRLASHTKFIFSSGRPEIKQKDAA